MGPLAIRKNALLSALVASRNTYPREFIGLFRGETKEGTTTAEDLLIAPLASYERDWSAFNDWLVPLRMGIVASFHSHPDSVPRPSKADLVFFAKTARYHFIAASPYSIRNTRAYDVKGKPLEFDVV
jgi:proteasome lid subunit RPN8/RPN11